MKKIYNENYRTLKKVMEEDIIRWKDLPRLWTGRVNIVEMAIFLKAIYRFNEIPIKK